MSFISLNITIKIQKLVRTNAIYIAYRGLIIIHHLRADSIYILEIPTRAGALGNSIKQFILVLDMFQFLLPPLFVLA